MVDHISLPLTKLITMGKFDSVERGNLGRGSREEDEQRSRRAGEDDDKSNMADNPRSSADESVRLDESGERPTGENDSDDDASILRKRSHLSYKKFPIMAPLGIGEKRNPLVKKLLSDPNSNMRRYFEMRKKGKYKELQKSNRIESTSSTSEIIHSSEEDVLGGEDMGSIEPSTDQKKTESVGTDSSESISFDAEKATDAQKTKSRRNEGGKIKDDFSEVKKKQQCIKIQETPESKQFDRAKKNPKPRGTSRKTITQESPGTKDIPETSSFNFPSCSFKEEVLDDNSLMDGMYNQTQGSATENLKKPESSHSRTKKCVEKNDDTKRGRERKGKFDPNVHKKKADEIIKSTSSDHKKGKQPSIPIYREKIGKDAFSEHGPQVAFHKPKHFVDKHSYPRPQIRPCLLMKTTNTSECNEDNSDEPTTSQRKRKSTTGDYDYERLVQPETAFSGPAEYSEPSTSSSASIRHPWDGNDEVIIREEKRRRLEALFCVTEKEMAEVSSSGYLRMLPRDQEQDTRHEKRRRLITPSQILKGKEQMAEKSLQRKRLHHKYGKERACMEHKVKLVTPSQILKGKKRSEEEKTERNDSKKSSEGKVKSYFHSDEETMDASSEFTGGTKDSGKRRRREKKKSKKRSESRERSHKSKKGKKRERKHKEVGKYEDAKNDEESADEKSAEPSFPERKSKGRRNENSKKEERSVGKEARGVPGNELTGCRNPIVNKPAKSYQKKKVQDNSHLADHDLVDDRFTIRKL